MTKEQKTVGEIMARARERMRLEDEATEAAAKRPAIETTAAEDDGDDEV